MKSSTLGKLLSKYIANPPTESSEAAARLAQVLVRLSSSSSRERRDDFLKVLESAGKAILESDFAENPFIEHLRKEISESVSQTRATPGEAYSRDISRHAACAFFSLFPREAENKPWLLRPPVCSQSEQTVLRGRVAGGVPTSPFNLDWKSRVRSVLAWPTPGSEGGEAYDRTVLYSVVMTTNRDSEKMKALMELAGTLPPEQAAKLKRAMFVRAAVELDPSAVTEDYFSATLFSEVRWTPRELFETVRDYLSGDDSEPTVQETPEGAPHVENLFIEKESDAFDRAAAVRRLFGEPRFAELMYADVSETEDVESRLRIAETLRLGGWSTGIGSYDGRFEKYVGAVVARTALDDERVSDEGGGCPAL